MHGQSGRLLDHAAPALFTAASAKERRMTTPKGAVENTLPQGFVPLWIGLALLGVFAAMATWAP